MSDITYVALCLRREINIYARQNFGIKHITSIYLKLPTEPRVFCDMINDCQSIEEVEALLAWVEL